MDKPILVVIGNGMAGVRLVERLCQLAAGRFRLVVIGEEPQAAYNRIMLTSVLSGEKDFADIVTHDADWYQRHDVTLLNGVAVTEICREARTVTVDGRAQPYDHLIIATGSRPFMPPLPGMTLAGVYGFRSQQDVDGILAGHYPAQPVVVIGGGVLGIEAAAALALRGMAVTLLHRGPHLMDQQLDAFAAGLLKDSLTVRGIDTLLQAKILSCVAGACGAGAGGDAEDGCAIRTERVVVTAGVRPDIALAQAAGLECDRGIVVNDVMQTSDPHISAIGECCQAGALTPGLVAPCWQQAETLAAHLAGGDYRRPRSVLCHCGLK